MGYKNTLCFTLFSIEKVFFIHVFCSIFYQTEHLMLLSRQETDEERKEIKLCTLRLKINTIHLKINTSIISKFYFKGCLQQPGWRLLPLPRSTKRGPCEAGPSSYSPNLSLGT
jgi:hypothetical protein